MKKRGQVSIFLIIGIVLVMLAGMLVYLNGRNTGKKTESAIKDSYAPESDAVMQYAQLCLKQSAEDALFDLIGLQAGYISPEEGAYGDLGTPVQSRPSAQFQEKTVPYYIIGTQVFTIPIADIEKKLEGYIEIEYLECLGKKNFSSIGANVTIENNVDAKVTANERSVDVMAANLIRVRINEKEESRNEFRSSIPVNLFLLHSAAMDMVPKIISAYPGQYDISSDCGIYNKSGKTNVYVRQLIPGQKGVIQFVDFTTYESNYLNSYIFQFAVSGTNITGNCS